MASKTKLTLSVDRDVVRRAKELARVWGTSVSSLVEQRLRGLTEPARDGTSLVDELRGTLPSDLDVEAYRRHLEEKHGG